MSHTPQAKRQCSLPLNFPWALGIFAKEPRPGQVKTRLTPPLSPETAAHVYSCSLNETVANLSAVPCDCVLFYAGAEGYFRQNFPDLPRLPQPAGDLGARIEHALVTLLTAGYQSAALVGSDSPDLPRQLVIDAFTALSTVTAVTIPARDGGYVLIGERQHYPALFRDIPWSTAGVMAATRTAAQRDGIVLSEVGMWEDMDDAAALQRLTTRSPHSATAQLILAEYSHCLDERTKPCPPATTVAGAGRPAD